MRDLKKTHLHFMGIGGQGISAVAQMALLTGEMVTGCDRGISPTVIELQQQGIDVQIGHSADHLDGVDTLVISPAVPALDPHNPELLGAQQRGVQVVTWQELLGQLMDGKCVLSVSGVHGKSTTTSMLSLVLTDAGLDPTCMIGAVVPRFGVNYRLGKSQYFVNEADEFNHNFWHYHPRLAIVKSIEYEHPEFFADYEAFLAAFEHFVRGMDMHGDWPLPPTLLLNADNSGCLELLERLQDWPGRILTFSIEGASLLSEPPAFEAYDIKLDGETSFRVRIRTGDAFPERVIRLRLPGVFNIENALSALAAAHSIGIPADSIINTLEDFGGTRRRFDIRHEGPLQLKHGEVDDVMLVDDYAHHPTAIGLTLEGARRRYPGRRLVAVYQPHMYSRTKVFFEQFLEAFDAADVVIIADIFPARERDTGLIHSRHLVAALAERPRFVEGGALVYHGGDISETAQVLADMLRSGDLAVIMGAGDIYNVAIAVSSKRIVSEKVRTLSPHITSMDNSI
ncbi:MAG TPA: UDP-N-acetylmuramate--L-alanine ligase [Ktedonobacteraceae bacterium]|jgi:UDP-N-acetylmuramate--alanine ligase|nr:UDP-N-acetylmuramate--L-alanine ligase [Ktedonobacteraceae bacterium]